MAKNNKRAAGLGLFAAPVTPVTARPPGGDQVQAELADWVRQRKNVDLANQLAGGGTPVAQQQGMPAPTSVGEIVQVATGVAGLHKQVAESAMQQAQQAKDELNDAKASAGNAYESGLQEGRGQMAQVMTVVQETNKTVLDLVGKLTETRIQGLQAQHDETLKRIDDKVEMALQVKDAEINRLTAENERLRAPRPLSPEEEVGRAIIGPILHSIKEKGMSALQPPPQLPQADSPELAFQRLVAQGMAEVTVERARDEVAAAREARSARAQQAQMLTKIGESVVGVLGEVRGVLGQAVGEPRGIERNGIPPGFPEEQEAPAAAVPAPQPQQDQQAQVYHEPSY